MRFNSNRMYRITTFLILLVLLGLISVSVQAAPPNDQPPGHSSTIIHVRFRENTVKGPPGLLLPPRLRRNVLGVGRLFSLSQRSLRNIRARGQRRSQRNLVNLNTWFSIKLKPGTDADAFIEALRALRQVEIAEFAPKPAPPAAVTPNFTANQGYLDAATDGIDAEFAWPIPGGNGSGITIYDVEYSWNQTHEDLSKVNGLALLLSPGDSNSDPFSDNNHGTAVLGEMIADNDSIGVTGISWGASIRLAPANTTNLGYNPANAILLAVADGSAGDVILIEQQIDVCGFPDDDDRYGPLEWSTPVFDAIVTAVANDFIVVEAAGNGNVNLDIDACDDKFDRTVRDSGAIIVGAGGSPTGQDRERLGFSSYGSRVDVQGWGENVATTGYGSGYVNPDDPTNPNFWYRSTFNGTSSASPIVTGAVANLQGIIVDHFGAPLSAADMRDLLVDTGSPQLGNTAQHIGPRPDLLAAIADLIPPPTADAGGPYNVAEGSSISLNASGSSDPNDADIDLTFEWDFDNDGQYDDATGINPTFFGVDGPATITVGLQVTNTIGLTDTDTATVNVSNVAPTVSLAGATIMNEGTSPLYTATATDPADIHDPLTYEFDCDSNGTFEVGPQASDNTNCHFDDNGNFTVTVRVNDGDGGITTDSVNVTVNNVAPTADFEKIPGDIFLGETAMLVFSNPFDPSNADTAAGFDYSVDCTTDGTVDASVLDSTLAVNQFDCQYLMSGTFTATGTIEDKDGGSSEYIVEVKVLTPQEATATIIEAVEDLEDAGALNHGQANSLIRKLENIIDKLDRGQTRPAINQLNAFIHEVSALIKAGILTPTEGDPLIVLALRVITSIGFL